MPPLRHRPAHSGQQTAQRDQGGADGLAARALPAGEAHRAEHRPSQEKDTGVEVDQRREQPHPAPGEIAYEDL